MVCQYNFVSGTTEMQCPALSTSKLCFGLLAFLYSCFFETVIGLLSHTLVYPQSFFRGCIDGEAVTEIVIIEDDENDSMSTVVIIVCIVAVVVAAALIAFVVVSRRKNDEAEDDGKVEEKDNQ